MKTKERLKAIRLLLPLVLTVAWGGIPLIAQERPVTFLLRQRTGFGLSLADKSPLTPAPLTPAAGLKSEKTAFQLSLWGTLVPTATVVFSPVGLLVGPSMGYFYAGMPGRGLLGMGIRTAGAVGVVAAIGVSWDDPNSTAGTVLAAGGVMLLLGSTIYDIADVKGTVRKHNRALQEKALTITPAYFAEHRTGGLSLQVHF